MVWEAIIQTETSWKQNSKRPWCASMYLLGLLVTAFDWPWMVLVGQLSDKSIFGVQFRSGKRIRDRTGRG